MYENIHAESDRVRDAGAPLGAQGDSPAAKL